MKKILFASTALVATAGVAAADIDFSGSAAMGLKYNGTNWNPHTEATLSVSMTGETDGGLSFGAEFDITAGAGGIDSEVVYIEGGFGKFAMGDVDNAVQAVTGLADIGFDGLGVDDIAEDLRNDTKANMLYTGTFGDFEVALSYDMHNSSLYANDWAVGARYTMGDYSFALAYDSDNNINTVHAQIGANVGDVALAALYSNVVEAGWDYSTFGVTAAYTMDAVTVTAAYSQRDINNVITKGFGLGVAYDLGGGATLAAGIGEVGGATVADLGITMKF